MANQYFLFSKIKNYQNKIDKALVNARAFFIHCMNTTSKELIIMGN